MWLTPHATGLSFKFLGHWPPVVWSQKTMGRIPCSPGVDRARGIKDCDNNCQLTTMTQTNLLSLLNKWMISGLGMKLSKHIKFQSHFTDWYLQIFHDNPLRKMPQDLIDQFDDKPALFQIMAWRHHARSHCLNLCWPISQTLYLHDQSTMSLGPRLISE